EVVRLHMSSGTTGRPVVTGYTRHDLELWAQCMGRVMEYAGVTSRDVVQNAYGYGLFTGGMGLHLGAEAVGATVVPTSSGVTSAPRCCAARLHTRWFWPKLFVGWKVVRASGFGSGSSARSPGAMACGA